MSTPTDDPICDWSDLRQSTCSHCKDGQKITAPAQRGITRTVGEYREDSSRPAREFGSDVPAGPMPTIKSKRWSKCPACGEKIAPQASIKLVANDQAWVHEECADV